MAQSVNLAQDLLRIHKVITRGLNVGLSKGKSYQQAGFIPPQERAGYSSYIHCLWSVLGAHHTSEDIIAFPAFRQVLPTAPYDRLAADHRKVETFLAAVPEAITDFSRSNPEPGIKGIVTILAGISEIWSPHIQIEEENFSEDKVNGSFTQEEQGRIAQEFSKHSQELTNPVYWIVPFVIYNLEPEDRMKMAANLPPMIMAEMVPKVWIDQWSPMKPFLLE